MRLKPSFALLALVIAGCGTAAHPAAQTNRSDRKLVTFTVCMRSHGVPMPDPIHRPGHTGLSVSPPPKDPATFAAWNRCGHYLQALIAAKLAGARARAAPDMTALSRYAQCMRGHAIPMLDPNPEGILNLGSVPGMASGLGRYTPQFRLADRACRHLLPADVGDDGSGP